MHLHSGNARQAAAARAGILKVYWFKRGPCCRKNAYFLPLFAQHTNVEISKVTFMSTPIPTQTTAARTPSANPALSRKPLPIRMFRWLFARVALTIFRVSVHCPAEVGAMLKEGGVLVTGHHVSKIDAPLISLTSPVPLAFASDTDYSRRSEAARRGMAFLVAIGCGDVFDLDATAPFAIRRVVKDLRAGVNVMIFPEGQITLGSPMPDMPGLDWIIERAGPRRVHVTLSGAEQSRLFAKRGTKWLPRIRLEYKVYEAAR